MQKGVSTAVCASVEVRVVNEINNQLMVERVTFGPMQYGRMDGLVGAIKADET